MTNEATAILEAFLAQLLRRALVADDDARRNTPNAEAAAYYKGYAEALRSAAYGVDAASRRAGLELNYQGGQELRDNPPAVLP